MRSFSFAPIQGPARRCATSVLALTLVLPMLAGCGAVYTEARVSAATAEQSVSGVGVEVVPLSIETVSYANAEAYQPRNLPAAFMPETRETPSAPRIGRQRLSSAVAGAPRGVAAAGSAGGPPLILAPDAAELTRKLPTPTEREPYRVGPSDVLSITFASAAGAAVAAAAGTPGSTPGVTAVRVQETGGAVIPEIGLVQVGGLTLDEIQAELLSQLARRRIDREVSVDVTGFNSQKIPVAGAVKAPAVKPITLSGLTLDQAIASAGGLEKVDLRYGVILLNREGETYRIPANDFVQNAWVRQLVLKDGDSVFVDRRYDAEAARDFFQAQVAERTAILTDRQIAQADAKLEQDRLVANYQGRIAQRLDERSVRSEARESFRARLDLGAEPRDFVYVAGEVGRQQRFGMPFDGRFTLADVLFQADGINAATGDPSEIYVIRRPLAGSGTDDRLTAFHLDAGNAAYLALATLFEMRPSDVIFVEAQPISEWNRVVTQALPFLTAADTGLGLGAN